MIDDLNLLTNTQIFNYPALTSKNNEIKPDSIAASDSSDNAVRLSLSPEARKLSQKFSNAATAKNSQIINSAKSNNEAVKPGAQSKNSADNRLTQEQLQVIQKLSARDRHVRNHEAEHMAVAGAYASGGPIYSYTIGPDGKQYAVGGEVNLNMSPVANDPEATINKAEIIRRGALAPSDPSGADVAVAAGATQMENQARQELAAKNAQNQGANNSQNNPANGQYQTKIKAYQRFLNPVQNGLIINQSA